LILGLTATASAGAAPLISAARNADLAAVRTLIQEKADVNVT
jgi:hypothetical protein